MIRLSLAEIADVTGGVVVGAAGDEVVTGPVVVDSRLAEPGGLFVAFPGEVADGHDYAASAVANGAAGVLGTRPTGQPGVVVDDPLRALGALAQHVLATLRGSRDTPEGDARPPVEVVAVTGSQGKTSAKDLLAAVLAGSGPTVATHESLNNEIGLPLTVLRADETTRYLVLEMGARGVGHIQELTRIAPPDVALVLNVGSAHLGEFGTIEETARAKGELVEALDAEGLAVLNADDPLVSAMRERTPARLRTFGETGEADVRVEGIRLDDLSRPSFTLVADGAGAEVTLRLAGEHQALNAAAVAAVATGLGIPLAEVAMRLGEVQRLSKWRMEVTELSSGVTVINDSYNANPESVRAALKALAAIGRARPEARTIAVLGEMRELGASAREEHDAIGRLAVRLDIHQLVVVGEAAKAMHLGAHLEGSWGEESVFVASNADAVVWLREHITPDDVVLVKASRGARLDEVAAAITDSSFGGTPSHGGALEGGDSAAEPPMTGRESLIPGLKAQE